MLRALSYLSHACVREGTPPHMQPISMQKARLFTKSISARPMHTAQASIAGTRAATLRYRTEYSTQGGIKNYVTMATNTTHRYAHAKVSQGPHNTRLLVATTAVLVAVAGMVGATVLGDAAQAKEKENTSKNESKEKPKSQDWRKKYTLGKRLGEGTFGTVYLAVDKATKARYAIKILKKRKDKRCVRDALPYF
ncbi:hypothetical protein SARC_13152 [Sphaeroforma arctica JP610]|uniref:Protein kinase domain-containing protein n=1 Tax=Sphaeroforma arctica JP610 TaxID=667725 RepID=A0A0L0FC13_9EUKA|nr:hypothetical protein SARC_13152 [Sphaeroforma arctica JP610]KNC74295.1 hypothetical protein SARC_13152 [Sphaeroforma arctica JP610]|eukprot:XP_014148197.1 hypothetical protein SARC_13152 [Sphaeroforma arctica JP610]